MHIFSFFSGSGFLDLGFENTGYTIDLVNEFSPAFIKAYQYSRAKMGMPEPKYGYSNIDVNEYLGERAEELKAQIAEARTSGEYVGIVLAPPCPDFSVAGSQKGRDGDNGKLSQTAIDLIIAQQPDFFLFENVKGLWSTAKHRAYYNELKASLAEYYAMSDRLNNALEFGVPQDRDRIMLFGVHKKLCDDLSGFDWTKYAKYNLEELKSLPWPASEEFQKDSVKACPKDLPVELTAQYWFEKNDVEHHPNGSDCFKPRTGLAKMQVIPEGDDSKKSYKRIHRWRYSPTVCYGNNEVHLHPYKERRLTVAESLSLQSLPKEFALPPDMSLTDKFKTTGNGVPYLMAKAVAQSIADFLKEVKENGKDNGL